MANSSIRQASHQHFDGNDIKNTKIPKDDHKKLKPMVSNLPYIESIHTNTKLKLPDDIYDCMRQAPKSSLHLHTKGSTPIILCMFDELNKQNRVANLKSGDSLEEELSIQQPNDYIKDYECGELRRDPSGLSEYQEVYAKLS